MVLCHVVYILLIETALLGCQIEVCLLALEYTEN